MAASRLGCWSGDCRLMVGSIGIGAMFIMFACAAIVGVVAGMYMIETRARRLEEIAS